MFGSPRSVFPLPCCHPAQTPKEFWEWMAAAGPRSASSWHLVIRGNTWNRTQSCVARLDVRQSTSAAVGDWCVFVLPADNTTPTSPLQAQTADIRGTKPSEFQQLWGCPPRFHAGCLWLDQTHTSSSINLILTVTTIYPRNSDSAHFMLPSRGGGRWRHKGHFQRFLISTHLGSWWSYDRSTYSASHWYVTADIQKYNGCFYLEWWK